MNLLTILTILFLAVAETSSTQCGGAAPTPPCSVAPQTTLPCSAAPQTTPPCSAAPQTTPPCSADPQTTPPCGSVQTPPPPPTDSVEDPQATSEMHARSHNETVYVTSPMSNSSMTVIGCSDDGCGAASVLIDTGGLRTEADVTLEPEEEINSPVEETSMPEEEINPPVEETSMPDEEINPPVEETSMDDISEELVSEILYCLPQIDQIRATFVCRSWRDICQRNIDAFKVFSDIKDLAEILLSYIRGMPQPNMAALLVSFDQETFYENKLWVAELEGLIGIPRTEWTIESIQAIASSEFLPITPSLVSYSRGEQWRKTASFIKRVQKTERAVDEGRRKRRSWG